MALSSVISYWKLDESSGTLVDSGTTGADMTARNSPTYSASGKLNTALTFASGSSHYLDATHTATLNSASYSVYAWIKRSSNPTECYVLSHDGNTGNNGWALGFYFNKIMCLHNNVGLVQSNTSVSDTNWHHVGFAFNGSTAAMYLDGAADGTPSIGNFIAASSTIVIGANKSSLNVAKAFFDGTIDEVGYANAVLTSTDFSDLYNGGSGKSFPYTTSNPMKSIQIKQAVHRSYSY